MPPKPLPRKPPDKKSVGKELKGSMSVKGGKPRGKLGAPRPIGKGKSGTGKRKLSRAGAGKKALKMWRGHSQASRRQMRKTMTGGEIAAQMKTLAARRKTTKVTAAKLKRAKKTSAVRPGKAGSLPKARVQPKAPTKSKRTKQAGESTRQPNVKTTLRTVKKVAGDSFGYLSGGASHRMR